MMANLTFVHPERSPVIVGLVVLGAVLVLLERRRGAGLASLLSARMQARLVTQVPPRFLGLRLVFLLLALFFSGLALLQPQTPGELRPVAGGRVGGDLMVVLDTSQSMLAEDTAPSRLGRAKAELWDLLSRLGGQRVGLVAFAGRAQVLCPLTPDYGFFRTVLQGVDTRSVSRGGTRIGDGLRAALEALGASGSSGGARLILLITDGEDQDSFPLDAARAAKDAGVRVVAIGFGDERGSEITLVDPGTGARRFLTDRQGQLVRSRLDGKLLRDVALATGGAYVPAGVAALDLDAIVREHIQPLFQSASQPLLRAEPREHYPLLILLALLSVTGAAWAGSRARRSGMAALAQALGAALFLCSATAGAQPAGGSAPAVAAQAAPVVQSAGKAAQDAAVPQKKDQPPRRSYNEGREAFQRGDLAQAEAGFIAARDGAGDDAELRFRAAFNLGLLRARKAEGLVKEKPEDAMAALQESAAWFRDAVRQRPEDRDARANLERVLRRAQRLTDQLNQGQNGLLQRLTRVLQDQRTLRDRLRGLLARLAAAGGGTEPLRFRPDFDDAATQERTLLADAGAVLDLAGQERDRLAQKAEAQRTPEERGRLVQLQNLEQYLNPARGTMAEVSRLLRRLQGERGHRQADQAVTELKRALEQLQDPVQVLRGLAGDQAQVGAETAALQGLQRQPLSDKADSKADKKEEAPPWLTPAQLADSQKALQPRALELAARLRAGLEGADKEKDAPQQSQPPGGDADAQARAVVLKAAREALPLVDEAAAAMGRAAALLPGGPSDAAQQAQGVALAALLRALERFSGVREVIELLHGEQTQVVALLTPPEEKTDVKLPALTTAQRLTLLREGLARNRDRAARLSGLLAAEEAERQKQAAPPGKAQQSADDAKAAEEQKKALAAVYQKAEALRREIAAGLERTEAALNNPAAARAPAKAALEQIAELRRIFFTIIEHLKDLHQQQTDTHDRTAAARADRGWDRDAAARRARLAPLGAAEGRHADLGKGLAEALAAQADQAAQGGAGQGAQPGQGHAQDAQKTLAQAAEEVKKAHEAMGSARDKLKEDEAAPLSPDLEPVLAQQKEALARLEAAIQLLEPPQQKPQNKDNKDKQQQEQQLSQEQAARRLQQIREREAERQRERDKRRPAGQDPVEKDW